MAEQDVLAREGDSPGPDRGLDRPPDQRLGRGRALRLMAAGLSLIAVCYGFARFAYGLFVPALRDEFALTAGAVGMIASGSYVAYCAAIIGSTLLTPRLGGRAVAVAAGAIATVGVLLVALAPTAGVLAAGVLIAGSSTGVASPPLAHAVAHRVPERARNGTQAVINAGTGVGVAVAGPIALLAHDQWRAAWIAFAVLCAIVTVSVAIAVPGGPRSRSGDARRELLLPRPLLPPGSGRIIAAAALTGASSAAVWTFGRDVLAGAGGIGASASSLAWIVLGACGVAGAAAGDLIRRFGIRASWSALMIALAAATVVLAAPPGVLVVALLASAVFGASYIALSGLLLIWGTEVYPRAPAAGVGLAFLLLAVGQAVGAPVVGAVSGGTSPAIAFAAAALVAVLGAVIRPAAPRGREAGRGDGGESADGPTPVLPRPLDALRARDRRHAAARGRRRGRCAP